MPDTRNNGNAKASTRAKNKNNGKNYDRLYPFTKKGGKKEIEEAAAAAKESLNIYIIKAIYERMEKEGWSHMTPPGEDEEEIPVKD